MIILTGFLYLLKNFAASKGEQLINKEVKNLNLESKFELTIDNKKNKPNQEYEGMIWGSGGEFSMVTTITDESC